MEQNKNEKEPIIIPILIWGGIIICVLSYVFTYVTRQMIPGLTPFSLFAAFLGFIQRHYRQNKENKHGMLRQQMIILCFFAAIPLVFGIMEVVAAIVGTK